VDFIQREAVHAFIDEVREWEEKQHLLMGGNRSLNEALNQALKLEEVKAVDGPPARLQEVKRVPMGMRLPPAKHCRDERPVCWQCRNAGHLSRDCRLRPGKEVIKN
jgi:hypothetical protein